jgi:hypothetical protein
VLQKKDDAAVVLVRPTATGSGIGSVWWGLSRAKYCKFAASFGVLEGATLTGCNVRIFIGISMFVLRPPELDPWARCADLTRNVRK